MNNNTNNANINNSLNYDYTSTSWSHALEKLRELQGNKNIEIYSTIEITEDDFRKRMDNDICIFYPGCNIFDSNMLTVYKMKEVLVYALNTFSVEDMEDVEEYCGPHQCITFDVDSTHPKLREIHEKHYKKYKII